MTRDGEEWLRLLGHNHRAFQGQAPNWTAGAVRPTLCGYAYHLAGFTGFNQLRHFDRLALACRVFGRRLVEAEIGQVRAVLTGWGYQYGQDHGKGVPSVMSQLFLLNRNPAAPAAPQQRPHHLVLRPRPAGGPPDRRGHEGPVRGAAGCCRARPLRGARPALRD